MATTPDLYELAKDKDREIAALRSVIDDLLSAFSEMAADDEREKAYDRAHETLREVYYRHGFKSDGRFRG